MSRRTAPPAHPDFNVEGTQTGRISSRRAAPVNEPKSSRGAPPPPKPAWCRYDPYNQPGETPSGGFIPNPPDYCDAPWVKGDKNIDWVDTSYCIYCADRKICEGVRGYSIATTVKNNEWQKKKEGE